MKKYLVAAALCALSANANAAAIVSLPGGTPLPIPVQSATFTTAPYVLAPGIVASPAPGSTFTAGYTGGYGFSSNGDWTGTSMIGLDLPAGYFTINFANPIQAFLGELNWSTDNSSANATMDIFGASGLLESLTLESAGVNAVAPGFHGFSRASNEITSVRFNNEYIGVRNISTVTGAIPEPATWMMMLMGFGLIGAAMRRKRQNVQVSFG